MLKWTALALVACLSAWGMIYVAIGAGLAIFVPPMPDGSVNVANLAQRFGPLAVLLSCLAAIAAAIVLVVKSYVWTAILLLAVPAIAGFAYIASWAETKM